MKLLFTSILMSLTLVQTESSDFQYNVVTPKEILANPNLYDGKVLHVKGYVVVTSHGHNMFESEKESRKSRSACIGLLGSKGFEGNYRKAYETLEGTFRKRLCGEGDVCLYWCSASGLEVDRN